MKKIQLTLLNHGYGVGNPANGTIIRLNVDQIVGYYGFISDGSSEKTRIVIPSGMCEVTETVSQIDQLIANAEVDEVALKLFDDGSFLFVKKSCQEIDRLLDVAVVSELDREIDFIFERERVEHES